MKKYNKLVRDRIPEVIAADGSSAKTHIATAEEYRIKLYEKLAEEVRELTENPSIEEAADLQEVFLTICKHEGWSLDEIEAKREAKQRDRGGFDQQIILESVS